MNFKVNLSIIDNGYDYGDCLKLSSEIICKFNFKVNA